MITTILFDLDGTLLPMDQDVFLGAYIKGLVATAAPYGYEPQEFAKAIMYGTGAMIKNNGTKTNEKAFWDALAEIYGDKIYSHTHIFNEFYQTEFQNVSKVCGFSPKSSELISMVRKSGFRVALATNPLFPKITTESRIRWAGLKKEDFEMFTSFENSNFSKPNPKYYLEICKRIGVKPDECLMIGNDVGDDMVAEQLGMKVFLLTDCLINKENEDISGYSHGSFDELIVYIENVNN